MIICPEQGFELTQKQALTKFGLITLSRGFSFLAGFSEDARATRALKGRHEAVCTPTPVLALQA